MDIVENKNNFIKRLFSFSVGPIINTFIGFFSVIVTTWFLFPEELGKAAMYTTAIEIISSVVFLGLLRSHAREYRNSNDKAHLLFNVIIVPLTISVIVLVFGIIFRKNISILLFGEYSILGIILFSIALPIKVIDRFAASTIRMEEKGKLYSFHQVLQKISSFSILLIFFLFVSPTYHAVLMASVGSMFINSISQILFMRQIWKNIFKQKIDLTLIKRILKFGLPLVPVAGLMWVFNSADKLMIRYFSDFNELGFYSGAFKIIALLNVIKKSFVNFWSPTSYRWFENNEPIQKYQKVTDYLTTIFFILAATLIIFKKVIFLLLSSKYYPSANVFPFLMFIPIMATLSESTMIGIQFKRKTHYQIYAAIIVAIFNIIGNLILIPKYGAVGASISTGLSYILFFYIRSYLSNKVWAKLDLTHHSINIILLLILAIISIKSIPKIMIFQIAIYLVILIYNSFIVKDIVKLMVSIISKKREKDKK